MALITAIESAPACITDDAFVNVMPPIATAGMLNCAFAYLNKSKAATGACGLVCRVGKTLLFAHAGTSLNA